MSCELWVISIDPNIPYVCPGKSSVLIDQDSVKLTQHTEILQSSQTSEHCSYDVLIKRCPHKTGVRHTHT